MENQDIEEGDVVVVVGGERTSLGYIVESIYSFFGQDLTQLESIVKQTYAYFHFADPFFPINKAGELLEMDVFLDDLTLPDGFGAGTSRGGCFVSFPSATHVSNWVVNPMKFCKDDPNGMFTLYEKGWIEKVRHLF